MRLTTLTYAAGAMLATLGMTGCSDVISLNSFAPENFTIQNPALTGIWSSADGDEIYVVRAKDKGYTITYAGKDSAPLRFEAKLFRAGDAEILDVTPAGEDDPFRVATHTPVRVWADGTSLKFAFLDSPWLMEQGGGQLAVQAVGKRVLITAPGDAVARFILLNGGDARAWHGGPQILHR